MHILGKVVSPPNVPSVGGDGHPREVQVATDISGFLQVSPETSGYDVAEQVLKVAMLVWNTSTLQWERYTGGAAGTPAAEGKLKKLVDQPSSTTMYVGEAAPGAAQSALSWRIQRITFNASGFPTAIEWAGGAGFNQAWTDRATASYA